MAEGDRFERALPKPWKRPYRMLCGRQPMTTAVDAITQALKEEVATSSLWSSGAEVGDLLCDSLVERIPDDWLPGMRDNHPDPRFALLTNLEALVEKNPMSDDLKLAKTAALKVHGEIARSSGGASAERILGRLAGVFGSQVLKARLLGPARDKILEKTARTAVEQLNYEGEILACVEMQSEKMLRPLFARSGSSSLRAPRKLTRRRKNTLDELNVGLTVQK